MKHLIIIICIVLMVLIVGCPKKNQTPDVPSKPKGPSVGQINVSYSFSTVATDPDGNDIAYQFYWGGDTSDWSNYVASGESIVMSKSWSSVNTYSIKARAKDKNGKISEWSEPHSILISAQTMWTKTYGGDYADIGNSVQQTTDGGYIIVGLTESYGAGGYDIWLIKTDSSGNMQWNKTFGGAEDDWGLTVQQTTDGGYIIFAEYYNIYNNGIQLIKTDNLGNLQWSRTFSGFIGFGSVAYGFSQVGQQTSDGGYVLTGTKIIDDTMFDVNVLLIKTDISGNLQWEKTFSFYGEYFGYGASVQQTFDGGYIITGLAEYSDSTNVLLIKTDPSGNMQWSKTFSSSNYDEIGYSVQQTSDGGYIITGLFYTDTTMGIILIKTNALGEMQWRKNFSGAGFYVCFGQPTTDGGYIISGTTTINPDIMAGWLIKTDGSGNMQWNKTYGGATWLSLGFSVKQTSDGGYILTGATILGAGSVDVLLLKTDANGNTILPSEKSGLAKTSSSKSHSLFSNRMGKFAEIRERK